MTEVFERVEHVVPEQVYVRSGVDSWSIDVHEETWIEWRPYEVEEQINDA